MYEQENQREEEHLAVAAGADPHSADVSVVEQEAGSGNPATDQPSGDNRNMQDLPSSGGVGGGRDCQTCKRNFWTSVLNAIIKIATIVLAAFGIQSFGTDD